MNWEDVLPISWHVLTGISHIVSDVAGDLFWHRKKKRKESWYPWRKAITTISITLCSGHYQEKQFQHKHYSQNKEDLLFLFEPQELKSQIPYKAFCTAYRHYDSTVVLYSSVKSTNAKVNTVWDNGNMWSYAQRIHQLYSTEGNLVSLKAELLSSPVRPNPPFTSY